MNKTITKDIHYVGVNDHKVDLFEGQYKVPNGMSYNSYLIIDDKVAVMDTVDKNFLNEWIDNIKSILKDRPVDYLIVQHMEPDHSANIINFLKHYPNATIISNKKAFKMMEQFFHVEIKNKLEVENMDSINLGHHALTFIFAPMVHWPEVMFTYDSEEKLLFSADAFGKFGALDVEDDWDDEARRYYIGIVGKYGQQVQNVLKKASSLDIKIICPLHGPVLTDLIPHALEKYNIWSSYEKEKDGIAIFYTSVYGNTAKAVRGLVAKLRLKGYTDVIVKDLARTDMSKNVELAFTYGKIVLATTTYNAGIFPFMDEFINHLTERNFQNKKIAIIENGSWSPVAAQIIKEKLSKCKNLTFIEPIVKILSSIDKDNIVQLDRVANELIKKDLQPGEVEDKSKLHHYVCTVCGYTYEGEYLPEDFVCPLCRRPASEFEQID